MKSVLLSLLFLIIVSFGGTQIYAQIQSPQYKIIEPTIGIDDTDHSIQTTLTKIELEKLFSQGYVLRSVEKNSLRATLSHSTLTFDNPPGEAQNVGTVLTISSKTGTKYQTLIQSQQGLKTVWGDEIPRTNCDSGCTINVARPWRKVDSTGFGYTLKGDDIAADFKDITYYRELPDSSLREEPKTILQGKFIKDTRQSTLIFRVNNPKDQPDGTYQTVVNIFVIPLH